jgi:hypothetical protein
LAPTRELSLLPAISRGELAIVGWDRINIV